MEFLDIVDDNDKIIGNASKNEIYEKFLTHRIVHVLVFNNERKIALQLQSKYKSFCPQHWVTTAGGHVKSGENYKEAALREFEEEVGVKKEVEFQYKDEYEYKNDGKILKKFLATFKTIFNGPFKINPKEVEKVEFFSLEEIQEMIKKGEKFHPELLFILKKHFDII